MDFHVLDGGALLIKREGRLLIPGADEVLPRLWIGTCESCAAVKAFDFARICVLEGPACDPNCMHHRVIGEDGKIGLEALRDVANLIDRYWSHRAGVLVHCGAGVERSPLVVAMWMVRRLGLTLDDAYAWLKAHRPVIEDRRHWLRVPDIEKVVWRGPYFDAERTPPFYLGPQPTVAV
jgi:hypothetical protein